MVPPAAVLPTREMDYGKCPAWHFPDHHCVGVVRGYGMYRGIPPIAACSPCEGYRT